MNKFFITCTAIVGFALTSSTFASPITPTSTVGVLSGATFGGTGIPNDHVAITTAGNVTLGLTATARYANPPVTDNGAGTYFASAGTDSPASYGRWNFDFYAKNNSASTVYLRLFWDLDPGVGTDASLLSNGSFALAAGATVQNSWNLGMGFLGVGFNPNAIGEYSFVLASYSAELATSDSQIGSTAINVNTVPDAGSTCLMLGATLAGIAGMRRKFAA